MTTEPKNASKKAKNSFSFLAAAIELMGGLPERSQKIVQGRYGMFGDGPKTLEEIGLANNITRERVRQVTREVQKKVKSKMETESAYKAIDEILLAIKNASGIIKEDRLVKNLGGGSSKEEGATRFFLDCIDQAESLEIRGELHDSYAIKEFDVEHWREIKNAAIQVLEKEKSPLTEDELFLQISKVLDKTDLAKKQLTDYLDVSVKVKKNNFEKWGLAEWKEISPKGTREKAYLILKENGKPMHFRDIAKNIDKYGLTRKKAHAQTVHNELIKDDKFVLVGRGIYALSEWGYRRGTVKDVLEKILKEKKRAMNKEELIKEVLKVRQVKISTIVINLNNFFKKTSAGTYEIARKK